MTVSAHNLNIVIITADKNPATTEKPTQGRYRFFILVKTELRIFSPMVKCKNIISGIIAQQSVFFNRK
jgi:hypothetical protein